MSRQRSAGRGGLIFGATLGAAGLGVLVFVVVPEGNLARLLGLLVAAAIAVAGLQFGRVLADSLLPESNVAEVSIEGPITRDGGRGVPPRSGGASAADVVEQIEQADTAAHIDGLVLELSTPGGAVVPSDDIRLAAQAFDGPTLAFARDTCASGGYWIASGCDRVLAREGSIVGSIGVRASRVTAQELAETLGLEYEQLTAGAYKEAGTPLKALSEDEREYLQGLVDDYYETFVERVSNGRDLEPEEIRATEARVFLAGEAEEKGLIDATGTRDDGEDWLADQLEEETAVQPFEPDRTLADRVQFGSERIAYAFGAGIASAFDMEASELSFR